MMNAFKTLLGICFWLCSFQANSSSLERESVVLRAVRGRDAVLPCGQGRVFLDGPDSYVLWMKENMEFLYRYPYEDGASYLPCDEDSCQDPTSLQLKRVEDRDAGFYWCRVHYQASPAVDFSIELRLVESPGTPKIFNADKVNFSGHVAQLSLGSNITLICQVEDDQPGTLVWWERNGVEIVRAESVQHGALRTTVQVVNATRHELDAHYECFAQNADVTEPLSASVVIKMYLPPISVEIRLNNNLDFEAGQPRVVDCVVVGCVPAPSITWHLGEAMLRPTVHKELHDGNFTVSSLTLAPSLQDDTHTLTCRAHNSHLPGEIFEDKVTLSVGFRPTCLNDHEVVIGFVAGQTESVTCTVDAYPELMQFSWTFADTKTLYTSVRKVPGYQHRYSSSLTWKPQDKDQGELLCRATNVLGEQKRPCVYSIVAGGPPLAPDCEIIIYLKTIKISCKKSWDGGRPQTIHLELQDLYGNTLSNVSDNHGHFTIPLLEEQNLTAVVYASNSRGRSDSKTLYFAPIEPTTAVDTIVLAKTPMGVYWCEAIVGTVLLGVVFALITRCIKSTEPKASNPSEATDDEDDNPTVTTRSDGSFHRQPDFQPVAQERPCPHIIVRASSCENQYSLTPIPSKARMPNHRAQPLAEEENKFPGLAEDEKTSYFV